MASSALAFWAPGVWELGIVLIVFGLTVYLIVVFFRLLLRNKKENVRLRLEVGKLADELERLRKQEGTRQGEPPGESR